MNKKIILLSILIITLLVLLTGCGSKKSGTNALNDTQNKFLGNWQDLSDSSRFAKVTIDAKNNIFWQDNEDKYSAHFVKDTLEVIVDKKDPAAVAEIVYIKASDNLAATFQGKTFEFKRK